MTSQPLTVEQAAAHLTISKSYLNKLRLTGGGPAFYKLGSQVRYRIEDLDAWFAAQRRTSTSDTGLGAA